MKLAFVAAANSPHTIKWANTMAGRGHSITLYSMPNHKNSSGEIDDKVDVVYLPFAEAQSGSKKNAAQLKAYLEAGSFNAVIPIDMSSYGLMVAGAKAQHMLLMSNGLDVYNCQKSGNKAAILKAIKQADAVCAAAPNVITKIKEVYKKDKKYFVTPFGVDMDVFCKKEVERGANPCFGSIKFLEYGNNVDHVIEAFGKFLKKTNIDATLKVVGDGPLEPDLKCKVQDMGIADSVEFLGYVKNHDMADVMNTMDVVVQMTTEECFGVSGVEAMACEVPMVASDTYGVSEYMLNSVTGYMVKAGNTDACCDRMIDLARNAEARKKMGVSCREDVLPLYNLSLCADKLEEAIKSVSARVI